MHTKGKKAVYQNKDYKMITNRNHMKNIRENTEKNTEFRIFVGHCGYITQKL